MPRYCISIARDLDDEMGGEYGALLASAVDSETYSEDLVPVIKAAQEKAGLKPDGVVGPRTVATLAGTSKADRIEKVLIALEQLRWLPSRSRRARASSSTSRPSPPATSRTASKS